MGATGHWISDYLISDVHPVIENGIFRFHRSDQDDFSSDYLSKEFLKELEKADELGWQKAVETALPLLAPWVAKYTRDYFFARYRSDFVESLGVDAATTVLDVGCGWGFASQRCLEKGARVVGVETANRRLQFCTSRFSQQAMQERFVGMELDVNKAFPFRHESFDVVMVSGVLEWLPASAAGNPLDIQMKFLQNCHATLKQEGTFYLAIENRFWWLYFLGANDLHTNQSLVSILPRRLARIYSILTSNQDYRVYTYSLLGYIRMLKKIGFRRLDIFHPVPDYVQPKKCHLVACELNLERLSWRGALSLFLSRKSLMMHILSRSFMFIGRK